MAKKIDAGTLDIKEKVVTISRVAKVVKGGRTFRFSALVVVGDENGHVGCGMGKAAEIPDAIRKGIEDAKKNMIEVPIVKTTIPHEVIGKYCAGEVLLKPASEGTGVIAGGSARAVLELRNQRCKGKSLRSNNPKNVVNRNYSGFGFLRNDEMVAKQRCVPVSQVYSGKLTKRQTRKEEISWLKIKGYFNKEHHRPKGRSNSYRGSARSEKNPQHRSA